MNFDSIPKIHDIFPSLHPDDREKYAFPNYLDAFQEEMEGTEDELSQTLQAKQIEYASGDNLDKIGESFGDLGKRKNRNDEEYRTYLKSLVQVFNGRGTKPGIRNAIASGVGVDPDQVTITEDFENLEFEVRIDTTDANFLSSTINELAEISSPSCVRLGSAPIVLLTEADVMVSASGTSVTAEKVGLGGGTLSMDGSSQLG